MTVSKHWIVANIHTTQTNNVTTINYAVVVFSWLSVSLSVSLSLLLDGLLFFWEDSLLPLGLFTPFFPSISGSFSITWSKARGIQARWRGEKYHNKHMLHHCGVKQHTPIFKFVMTHYCFSSRLSAVVGKPMLHHALSIHNCRGELAILCRLSSLGIWVPTIRHLCNSLLKPQRRIFAL